MKEQTMGRMPARVALGVVLALACLAVCLVPQSAQAEDNSEKDIVVGMFTGSPDDWTNNVFASYDGETFYRIASVYNAAANQPYYNGHYPQQCPSIMYHDGYFWCLSAWPRNDGKFWPMISYSKDLVHWTHPEGEALINGTRGIELDELPPITGGKAIDSAHFDTVAPEWSVGADGEIYIVFSAGYYGEFHSEATVDQMQGYIVHVTELSASDGTPDGDSGYLYPRNLRFNAETAHKLAFTNYENANYIDGQLYAAEGTNYLIIKRDGLTNQILRSDDPYNGSSWQMVNERVTFGYEAPCITELNGSYLLYADGVIGSKPLGEHIIKSDSISKSEFWGEPDAPIFMAEDNSALSTRHGTAITLKAGTEEWQAAKDLLDAQNRRSTGVMHRLYNSNSGEHFYTARGSEAGILSLVGWNYEGLGWIAPESSDTPVYRLYNANGGEHHYTYDVDEKNTLVAAGWSDEGIGWYSDDDKSVALHREYNPNEFSNNHNYTTDTAEHEYLLSVGWRDEGFAWYGIAG